MSLGHRNPIASLAVAAVAVALLGVEEMPPSLSEWTTIAETIARVRVTGMEPVEFGPPGKRQTCGYRYRAEVVEALKGKAEPATFFSTHDSAHDGTSEYLVFIFHPDIEALRRLATNPDGASQEERDRSRCEYENSEYYVRSDPLTMIPFDPVLAGKFGAPWLRRAPPNLLWSPGFAHADFVVDGGMRSAVRWEDARGTILDAVHRAPRP